jgi:hypothetical protein
MAVGGSKPEFIYAGVAFFGAGWLVERMGLGATGITIIVSTILLVLGISFCSCIGRVLQLPARTS